MEIWNKRMYRWVKKGATGIALLDTESGSKTRLRYVFDVKDTFKIRELGKDPYLWEINEEHHGILVSHLAKVMGYDGFGGNLADILHEIAQEHVENCIDDAYQDFLSFENVNSAHVPEELVKKVEMKNLMINSSWYTLLRRCGLDTEEHLSSEDFMEIMGFNHLVTLGHVGSRVNAICRPLLMHIGRYIKNDLEEDLAKTVAKEQEMLYNEFNTLIRESNNFDAMHVDKEMDSGREENEDET